MKTSPEAVLSGAKFQCLVFAAVIALFPTQAAPHETETLPDCYDALVSAHIVNQIPSIVPDCPEDCTIMRWPWFIGLEVRRVIEGHVESNALTVLHVQHADYRSNLGARRWWLRRNSAGGFNAVRFTSGEGIGKCPANAVPAPPYYQPRDGETLEDVRRAGAAHFGRVELRPNP